MTDLLQLVRKATIDATRIEYQDGYYLIGEQRFYETSKTIFKRTLKSDDYHYTLKDIVFFLENASLSVAEYRRRAVESRITAVVEQDRHALQQYLTGKIDNCPQLDLQAASSIAAQNAQLVAKLSGKDGSSKPNKKETTKRKHIVLQQENFSVTNEDSSLLKSLRADEYTPYNRLTVLNVVGTDFAMALKLFNDKVLKPKEDESAKRSAASSNAETPFDAKKSNSRPILMTIIVPAALTSTITMYTAREFLETGDLLGNAEQLPDRKKPKAEIFFRKISDTTNLSYRIIDDPTKLTIEEWERVVAVFVTGQTWQFRGWKYENPAELFQHVLGVHLMYDDRQPPATIQSWNCKVLKVNQYKQHVNAAASREFWMMLDDFVRVKKPSLLA